jgi:hypothetical protein
MNTSKLSGAVWRKSSHSGSDEDSCVEVAAMWKKSSYSGSNEGSCVELSDSWDKSSHSGAHEGECVELTHGWQKSRHSGANEGDCVEVGQAGGRVVAARDSKDPEGPVLWFGREAWGVFFTKIKAGELDLHH